MSDHPLLYEHVTLTDGRTGTIIDAYNDGEAFMLELSEARGIEDLITVYPEDIHGAAGLIARHHPSIAKHQRGEGFTLHLDRMSPEEFEAFLGMTYDEQKDAYGDFTMISPGDLSSENFMRWLSTRTEDFVFRNRREGRDQ